MAEQSPIQNGFLMLSSTPKNTPSQDATAGVLQPVIDFITDDYNAAVIQMSIEHEEKNAAVQEYLQLRQTCERLRMDAQLLRLQVEDAQWAHNRLMAFLVGCIQRNSATWAQELLDQMNQTTLELDDNDVDCLMSEINEYTEDDEELWRSFLEE